MKSWTFYLVVFLMTAGCTSTVDRLLQKAEGHLKENEFELAYGEFEKVVLRSPDSESGIRAAREAAKIAFYDLKNFEKSAEMYRHIVYHSSDPDERLRAQKQVVAIYFEQLNNYASSVIEINKLLPLLRDPTERAKYKMNLARSYYYQNNFFQAEMEVDEFLQFSKNEEQNFQMMVLKANIAMAKKDSQTAILAMKKLLNGNPQLAAKENLGLTLAVVYEELKDYKGAIETLEQAKSHHPNPDFLEIRISRLKERMKNQPGARGFRK